jgi:hypothetical protein
VPAGGKVAVGVTNKLLDLWAVEMSGEGVAQGIGQCRVPIVLCCSLRQPLTSQLTFTQ